MFSNEDKAFAAEFLDRVVKKVTAMAPEIGANFPTTNSRIGEWDPKGTNANISGWTTAFLRMVHLHIIHQTECICRGFSVTIISLKLL